MSDLWEHVAKTYRGKPSTFASYEHRWRNHVEPDLGRRRLDSRADPTSKGNLRPSAHGHIPMADARTLAVRGVQDGRSHYGRMIEQRYGHLYEGELQKKIDRLGAEA
jgi:hypothetical protein